MIHALLRVKLTSDELDRWHGMLTIPVCTFDGAVSTPEEAKDVCRVLGDALIDALTAEEGALQ